MRHKRRFLVLGAVCGFVGWLAVLVVQKGYFPAILHQYFLLPEVSSLQAMQKLAPNQSTASTLVSYTDPAVREIREEDRKFLEGLLQNQNKRDLIGGGNEPVPKAELVVSSATVKRGELVVHSGTIKRAELVRARH